MRTALAQINPEIGNIDNNLKKILAYISNAKQQNIDLIIFPELSLTGRYCRDLFWDKQFLKKQSDAIKELINSSKDINIIIGAAVEQNDQLYNSILLMKNGECELIAQKNQIDLSEKKYFTNGMINNFAIVCGNKIKVFFDELSQDIDADIFINMSSKYFVIEEMNKYIPLKNANTEIFINPIGINDQLIFDGKSKIYKNGQLILAAKAREEDFLVFDTEKDYSSMFQEKVCEEEEIFKTLSFALKDFCLKTGFSKIVLGLSGGIDSALTAAIACEALGAENVLGIKMPSKYSSIGSITDSDNLVENLGMKCLQIPIKPLFDCFLNSIQDKIYNDLAEENIQARFRGIILMSYSNRGNYLLMSTGNKSEAAMGYCTLYGDTCGAVNAIVDIYKTQVYAISRWLNSNKEIIPQEIIDKAPSAELRPGQKDQDSLPEYEILDGILKCYMEHSESPDEICKKYDKNLVNEVLNKLKRAEFKRKQGCLGFKVSKWSFAFDVDYPIVQSFKH